MVKKAHIAVQRSARPGAVPPADASAQERDQHAALEEMGTTMRVQQRAVRSAETRSQEGARISKDVDFTFLFFW